MLFGGCSPTTSTSRGLVTSKITVALISATAWFPIGILYPLMESGTWTLIWYAPAVFIAQMPWGVGPAAVQEIMPNRVRGQASAIYLFLPTCWGSASVLHHGALHPVRVQGRLRGALVDSGGAGRCPRALGGPPVPGIRSFQGCLDRLEAWREAQG